MQIRQSLLAVLFVPSLCAVFSLLSLRCSSEQTSPTTLSQDKADGGNNDKGESSEESPPVPSGSTSKDASVNVQNAVDAGPDPFDPPPEQADADVNSEVDSSVTTLDAGDIDAGESDAGAYDASFHDAGSYDAAIGSFDAGSSTRDATSPYPSCEPGYLERWDAHSRRCYALGGIPQSEVQGSPGNYLLVLQCRFGQTIAGWDVCSL